MKRRDFLVHSLAATAVGTGLLAAEQNSPAAPTTSAAAPRPTAGTEPKRPAPFELASVREFVGVGHGNLPRVKEMLAGEPKLVLACYDWGAGDFETALGGAAHTGHRDIALHLLDAGARVDAFAAAMLGETEMVTALLRFSPASARTRGPHGYTLLYHAGYSGKVALAEPIAAQLTENRAAHFNQALQTASVRGHAELVAWLLEHGVDNPNTKDFRGRTPLDLAIENNHADVAELLRHAGAVRA